MEFADSPEIAIENLIILSTVEPGLSEGICDEGSSDNEFFD